jgi:alpha-2-macroglobulin
MKTSPLKKVAIGIVAIAVIAFGVFYVTTGRSDKPTPDFIDPAFGEHISSYTAGVISSRSSIRIILSKDAVDSSFFGNETTVKLFSLSPSAKGKTIWLDARTVEFTPEDKLASGQVYAVKFDLGRIMDVPKQLQTFEYSFQVIPQNFEITIDNIKPYEKTDLKRQKIEGTLITADVSGGDEVEKFCRPSRTIRDWRFHGFTAAKGNSIVSSLRKSQEKTICPRSRFRLTGKRWALIRHWSRRLRSLH